MLEFVTLLTITIEHLISNMKLRVQYVLQRRRLLYICNN